MSSFEAGALIYRIQTVGADVFQRDTKAAEQSVKELGATAEATSKKVTPTGEAIDKTGKAAKGSKAPLDDAAAAQKRMADEATAAEKKLKAETAEIDRLKKESDAAATTIGTAAVGIGAAVAAMATLSVAKFADFDEGMSRVSAATMATAAEQEKLGDAAVEAGADSVYSAREAADAQTELAKAGVSVNNILGGALTGSLALAAAGELGVARAAEIAATTLTVFGLKGQQAGHVADLLAAGAGKAQGSVDDLALGLEYVGPTFARLNIPLEETVGTLAMLASNGILGEKAGTGLRGVIQSLTAPVAKGAEEMKKYGINVFDASGNFIGMEGAAGELQKGLGGLDEQTRSAALGAIFGAESANVAGILYAQGAEGVAKWTDNVNDQGFAADQAARMTDNLTGDLERLGGAMDSALIQTGSVANDTLREMVQVITALVDWYGGLDEGVQGTVLVFGVGTAAALLFGGTLLLAIPKIAAFKDALLTLNTTMSRTAIVGGAIGVAITAAAVIIGMFASKQADAKAKLDSYTASLDANTGAFTKNTREKVFNDLKTSGIADNAKLLGISLEDLTSAALGEEDALKRVTATLDEFRAEQDKAAGSSAIVDSALNGVEEAIFGTRGELGKAKQEWKDQQEAMGENGEEAATTAESYEVVEDAIDGVITSLQDLATEIDASNGKNLDAREAARQLEESYRAFDEALKENGSHLNQAGDDLDITTEKGAKMQAALDQIADAAMKSGQAIIDAGGGYGEYKASLESSREALLTRINELGITGDAAGRLADKILSIPDETQWKLITETAAAEANLRRIQNLINGIGSTMQSHVSQGWTGGMTEADGGRVEFYAKGGRSENHIAQFARAGTMRVWAEPETGGEYYIPASPAKRQRSTQILAMAAGEFGYQLVPAGAQAYADGGRGGAPVPLRGDGARTMTGQLYLDSGEFLGTVRGLVREAFDEEDSTLNAGFGGY